MINYLDAGPGLEIAALADVFPDRVAAAREQLKKDKGIDVPDSRCFTGFDAYLKLIDSGVDVVLHCTPPHFRPAHFAAAVAAGKHSFLEKPVAVDPTGVRAVLATAEQAAAKGLSVMTGTQLRREASRIEVRNRVLDGAIGDILSVRAFRNQGALWYRTRQDGWSDMEWMLRDWVNWNWLSGDHIVEQHIHHLDAMIWVLGKAPVKAVGMGGRVHRQTGDQYDFFSVDYAFDNGVHMHSTIRQVSGCANLRDETFVGTKGSASLDQGAIFDRAGKVVWKFEGEGHDSLVQEHADFVSAIRSGTPINTAKDTAIATLVAIMGRESAYTGKGGRLRRADGVHDAPGTGDLRPRSRQHPGRPAPARAGKLAAFPMTLVNHRDTKTRRRTKKRTWNTPRFCASLCFCVSVVDDHQRGGIASNIFSMFSSTAIVEATLASRYRSPIAAVDCRASPHVPDLVAQYTDPGLLKKNAVCTAPALALNGGNGGNSAFALSMSTRSGLMRSTAEVSAALACMPFSMLAYSLITSGGIPSQ